MFLFFLGDEHFFLQVLLFNLFASQEFLIRGETRLVEVVEIVCEIRRVIIAEWCQSVVLPGKEWRSMRWERIRRESCLYLWERCIRTTLTVVAAKGILNVNASIAHHANWMCGLQVGCGLGKPFRTLCLLHCCRRREIIILAISLFLDGTMFWNEALIHWKVRHGSTWCCVLVVSIHRLKARAHSRSMKQSAFRSEDAVLKCRLADWLLVDSLLEVL